MSGDVVLSPLFMVKKRYFEMYESGVKDVELRDIKPQWKNAKIGDIATMTTENKKRWDDRTQ